MANLAQNGVPTDNQSAWGLLQSSPLEGTSKIYLVKDILNNYDNILRYVINNKVNIDGLAAAPAFVNLQTQVDNSLQQGLDSKVNKTDYTNDLNNVHSSINQAQTAAVTTSKSYTDSSTSNLKNSLPNFNGVIQDNDDLDNFKNRGIYYHSWSDTIVKNAPTNDDNSKAGELIVFNNVGVIAQVFISAVNNSQVYVRNYSGNPAAWQSWTKLANDNDLNNLQNQINGDINNLQNQINGTGIGRTQIQWPNGAVTGGNGVYKLIKNNILYINGYGRFNVDAINNYIVANIPEAKGRVIMTALWIDSVSVDTIVLKENGDIEFWGSDLRGKWFYVNAVIPLI